MEQYSWSWVAWIVADEVLSTRAIDQMDPHMERCGLTPLIVAFPNTINVLHDTLLMAKDFNAPFVIVIGQVMPLSVEGMIPVVRRWIEMSEKLGMPIQFETHRNCITNDL